MLEGMELVRHRGSVRTFDGNHAVYRHLYPLSK